MSTHVTSDDGSDDEDEDGGWLSNQNLSGFGEPPVSARNHPLSRGPLDPGRFDVSDILSSQWPYVERCWHLRTPSSQVPSQQGQVTEQMAFPIISHSTCDESPLLICCLLMAYLSCRKTSSDRFQMPLLRPPTESLIPSPPMKTRRTKTSATLAISRVEKGISRRRREAGLSQATRASVQRAPRSRRS